MNRPSKTRLAFRPADSQAVPAVPSGISTLKFFESAIDPFFAVERTFREEKRASHTASHAVIPAGHGNIDEMCACNRHGCVS